MSFTVNFHIDDDSAGSVERINERTLVLHLGDYPGEHVSIFGSLERLQRLVAQLHVGLEQFEPEHQEREHSVLCAMCLPLAAQTWNRSGLCDHHEAVIYADAPPEVAHAVSA